MASLELCKITKRYGEHTVIQPLDLKVPDGTFTVLVGPSGCGKSTLLRLMAGLESISDGDMLIDNNQVNHVEPAKRDVAMVFQSYALYPHLSVEENMAFHMKSKKVPKKEQIEKVAKVAEVLGITPLLKRLPKDLSGGQRQRVAMGRAMVRSPKVFLFDEPLSNLDAQLRMELRAEIKALHQALKTTIVYVTHDQIEAMTLADMIVVMKAGVIVQKGSPLEVYDYPVNTFVAQFIGSPSMNLIPALLGKCGDLWKIRNEEFQWPVSSHWRLNEKNDGQSIQLGIRPSDLTISHDGEGISAHVNVVEMTGDMTLIHLQYLGTRIHLQHHGRIDVKSGDVIKINFDPERAHLFDANTGKRLEQTR